MNSFGLSSGRDPLRLVHHEQEVCQRFGRFTIPAGFGCHGCRRRRRRRRRRQVLEPEAWLKDDEAQSDDDGDDQPGEPEPEAEAEQADLRRLVGVATKRQRRHFKAAVRVYLLSPPVEQKGKTFLIFRGTSTSADTL